MASTKTAATPRKEKTAPVAPAAAPSAARRRTAAPAAKSDAQSIYQSLRKDILAGTLAPGEVLNTVHLAREHNVSRMPVREALRMLQSEGLVDAPYQYRMRVKAVSAEEVDVAYATWILMQSLAVGLTVPATTPQQLQELRDAVKGLSELSPINARSMAAWSKLHVAYSRMVVRHAGTEIIAAIESCWLRTERARRAVLRTTNASWQASQDEHASILEAFEQGSVMRATEESSMHLARVALEVIEKLDPHYEPRAIRQAIRMTTSFGTMSRLSTVAVAGQTHGATRTESLPA